MGASAGVMACSAENKQLSGKSEDASTTVIVSTENSVCLSTASFLSNKAYLQYSSDISFKDLNYKFQYVTSNPPVLRAFLRYLFNGMWVIDIFQISSHIPSSVPSSPSNHVSQFDVDSSKIISELLLSLSSNTLLADPKDQLNWQDTLQSLISSSSQLELALSSLSSTKLNSTKHCCLSKLFGDKHHHTIHFLQEYSPHGMDNILILTIALAIQVFCRSELFLQLSEQQWSCDSIRLAPWQDYARGGRSYIIDYCEHLSKKQQQPDATFNLSTVTLLDGFYSHLFLQYSQEDVMSLLVSQKRHADWTHNLHLCLSALPIHISIFEMSPNFERQWHGYYKNHHHKFEKCYNVPMNVNRKFSFETTNELNYRLATSTDITFLVYRHQLKDSMKWQIECLHPVYRCPLITYDSNKANFVESFYNANDLNTQSLDNNDGERFDWHVNRVVHTSGFFFCDETRTFLPRLSQLQDVSFLLSHICG